MKRYISLQEGKKRENGETWKVYSGTYGAKYNDTIRYFSSEPEAEYFSSKGHSLIGDDEEKNKKKKVSPDSAAFMGSDINDNQKKLIIKNIKNHKGHGVIEDPETGEFLARGNVEEGGESVWLSFDDKEDAENYQYSHKENEWEDQQEKLENKFDSAEEIEDPDIKEKLNKKNPGVIKSKKGKFYAKPDNENSNWKEFNSEEEAKEYSSSVTKPEESSLEFLKDKKEGVLRRIENGFPVWYARPDETSSWKRFTLETDARNYSPKRFKKFKKR